MLVVTTNEVAGYRIVKVLGLARGLSVRSRSIVGNVAAMFQIMKGGNISIYTRLAEAARQEAYDLLVSQATEMGGNAIIAMRYDANEIASAVTECIAYGTVCVLEPIGAPVAVGL